MIKHLLIAATLALTSCGIGQPAFGQNAATACYGPNNVKAEATAGDLEVVNVGDRVVGDNFLKALVQVPGYPSDKLPTTFDWDLIQFVHIADANMVLIFIHKDGCVQHGFPVPDQIFKTVMRSSMN